MRFSPYDWSAADLVGGDPALDFVNTASRWRSEPVDRLGDYAGLWRWARLAGLVEDEEAGPAAAEAEAARTAAFAEAQALRAALWRIFDAAAHGAAVAAPDLETLRRWTRRAAQFRELAQSPDGFRERWTADAPPLEKPLFAIALAAENLLKSGRLDRLHVCGGDNCEWIFLDNSKNASRRWCSMATCGNDAKVKKFRRRRKAVS
jgi:predicted RNA-binding Zn ribbon-like protein